MSSSSGFVPLPVHPADAAFEPWSESEAPSAEASPPAGAAAPSAAPRAADPAYRRGFEDGLAKGREEGMESARAELPIEDAELLAAAARTFDEAARRVAALQRGYCVENRQLVVDLAVALAERLLRREFATDPDALVGVVGRALEALGDEPPARLRVAPALAEALQDGRAAALAAQVSRHGMAIEADARLAPGDVRVLAERAGVDARLGECLRRLGEELHEAAEQAPTAGVETGADAAETAADGAEAVAEGPEPVAPEGREPASEEEASS